MKKTIPKLLTLVCLLAALMGLSAVTAHAETISGTISGGRNYHYYEDKSNVPQWGPFISTKLKYFTRSDTGKTVPAYCVSTSLTGVPASIVSAPSSKQTASPSKNRTTRCSPSTLPSAHAPYARDSGKSSASTSIS